MGVMFQDKDGKLSRDLSWMDWPYLRRLSPDGKTILFDEEGNAYGRYETMIRATDGSPAIRLGEGYSAALSRDKVWALSGKVTIMPNELWLLPVGAGEARRLSPPNLDVVPGAAFLPDGKRVIYVAREGSQPQRTYIQNMTSDSATPMTPEGVIGFRMSPDEKYLAVTGRNGPALFD